MMQSRWHAWGPLTMVGLGSGVVSCLLTTWIVAEGTVSMPLSSAVQFNESVWARRLDELASRIESRLAEIPAKIASSYPERTEISSSTASSGSPPMDRLERIEQILRALTSGLGSEASLSRSQPARQAELDSLHVLDRQDSDAARRSTMLLTASEVATRFGFPDEVDPAEGGGSRWNYYHRGPTGERDGRTLFFFRDGRVAWHEISIPNR